MIKNITYIAPHKTALTLAIVMAFFSLIFIIPMSIMFGLSPPVDKNGIPVDAGPQMIMMLILPVIYLVFGYIFTAFGAWVYNKVAGFTGGIEVKVSQ